MLQGALQSPVVPRLYANGVGLAMSGGDVIIVLFTNGVPVSILNLPFITTRGLSDDLATILKDVEAAIGAHIPTPKELAEGMARVMQAKAEGETFFANSPYITKPAG